MRRFDPRLMFGLLLIVGGVLFLLQNFGYISSGTGWLWAIVFGVVGLAFLSMFVSNRLNWWALIPSLVLLDLALLIALGEALPRVAEQWGGAVFLAGLSLPFWAIYLVDRAHWWSLIPAGVLATLGAVAGLSQGLAGMQTGGLFFLGLGLTFFLVWLAPTPHGRMTWAIFPALGLLALGALLITPFATLANILVPVMLILGGVYLLYHTFRPRAS